MAEDSVLRKLEERDALGMLEWMQDSEIQKCFRFNMKDKSLEDVLSFIRNATVIPRDGGSVHFAVVNENDEYMGTISLKNFNMDSKNAEYAISMRKQAQGTGLALKATKQLIDLAFNEFHLERVYLNVLSQNTRAVRFYEKAGFIYEGEFRKHLYLRGNKCSLKWFSILKEESNHESNY